MPAHHRYRLPAKFLWLVAAGEDPANKDDITTKLDGDMGEFSPEVIAKILKAEREPLIEFENVDAACRFLGI